jgi:acetyl/propionyl-CoA carboxylase alpha subunit
MSAVSWITVEFGGKPVTVPALKWQGKLWFHWQGETHCLETSSGTRRSQSDRGKANPGVILAPMPGKVTRVHVTKGASVTKGQPLVVMEAMKMEYTLEADIDGQVKELNATEGSQVALGELLIRVEGEV